MNIKRIFDFSKLALEKFPNEDCLVTKKNGTWIKTSTAEFINQGNKISYHHNNRVPRSTKLSELPKPS